MCVLGEQKMTEQAMVAATLQSVRDEDEKRSSEPMCRCLVEATLLVPVSFERIDSKLESGFVRAEQLMIPTEERGRGRSGYHDLEAILLRASTWETTAKLQIPCETKARSEE